MELKSYYKLVSIQEPIGTLINTEDKFDTVRIARFTELQYLLNLFFETSSRTNISICHILSQIYPEVVCPQTDVTESTNLTDDIEKIRNEINRTNFILHSEFRFFNDLVLAIARSELINEGFILPDRFKSHYFFDSLEQCFAYYVNLPSLTPCRIIEVEFLNIKQVYKLDNMFLTRFEETFTANDFYKQAKRCLSGDITDNPIFEIVYQGTYRIKKHIMEM